MNVPSEWLVRDPRSFKRFRATIVGLSALSLSLIPGWSCAPTSDETEHVLAIYKQIESQMGFEYETPYIQDSDGVSRETFILTNVVKDRPFEKAGFKPGDDVFGCGVDGLHWALFLAQGMGVEVGVQRGTSGLSHYFAIPPERGGAGKVLTLIVRVPTLKINGDPKILEASPWTTCRIVP